VQAKHPPLRPRPARGFGSLPAIALGIGVAVVAYIIEARTAPCPDFHVATQFSGSNQRLLVWIGGCKADIGAARSTLAADTLLAVGYAFAGVNILRRWWPLYQAPRLKQAERLVIALPVVAGALDIIENIATLSAVRARVQKGGLRLVFPDHMALPTFISTTAWLKLFALAAGALAVAAVFLLAYARRNEAHRPEPELDKRVPRRDLRPPTELGVSCSGGGIRSAAFSLGALDELERAGVMDRTRWLTAVSGGNYAATSWTLAKAADPSRKAAADVIAWVKAPIGRRDPTDGRLLVRTRSAQHRFLLNGPGGLGRSVIDALLCIALNIVVLGALVAALSWPVGRIVGSMAIEPKLHVFKTLLQRNLDMRAELWLPGLTLLVAAGALFVVSAMPIWRTSWLWRLALVVAAIGIALEVLTVGIPAAMVWVGRWMQGGSGRNRPTIVGSGALLGALGVVWRYTRKPILNRVQARLPKLGGVLLVLAAVVWGGKVATDAATVSGWFANSLTWLATVVAFVIVYLFVGITQPSIHRLYRKRLRRTFGVARDDAGALRTDGDKQVAWPDLPDIGPELVVCCAQQRNGIAPGGLPADTFTISKREVRIGDVVTGTDEYLSKLPSDLQTERFVSSWMATSGAAFASAMGRLSQGSTNALMAAFNIDLGIWLPNPRLTSDPDARFPKVRFGYLFKEILGWYDEADRFVFVADGGHWDNLGLVELLRRRCATIVCIDASGDSAGGFSTLRQAVELASLELPEIVADIELDGLTDITGTGGQLPKASVAALKVNYTPSAPTSLVSDAPASTAPTESGVIFYAKAQLAADLDVTLRRYSKADMKFPNYSTASLFLADEQFDKLVALGRAAGRRLVSLVDQPPASGAAPDTAVVFDAASLSRSELRVGGA